MSATTSRVLCLLLLASVVFLLRRGSASAAPTPNLSSPLGLPTGEDVPPEVIYSSNGEEQPEKKKEEVGDPIRVSSGQAVVSETDMSIAGRGIDFEFTRTYRSGAERYRTTLGERWCHSYDQKIILSIDEFETPPPNYSGPSDVLFFPEEEPAKSDPKEWALFTPGALETYNSVPGGAWWMFIPHDRLRIEAYLHDGTTNIDKFSFGLDPSRPQDWAAEPGVPLKMLGVKDPTSYPTWGGFKPPKSFHVRSSDGTIRVFNLSEFGCDAQRWMVYRLASQQDRHGNKIYIGYEWQSKTPPCGAGFSPWFNRYWRPSVVIDTLGRAVQFFYRPEGWLEEVRDFTGRSVTFDHDPIGNLTAVRSPIVTGTPTSNDFPQGRTTRYEYDVIDPAFPVRRSNMVGVYAPNEVAAGPTGVARAQFVWKHPYTSVVRQVMGGVNASGIPAGGAWTLIYERSPGALGWDYGWFVERSKTLVIDPSGNVTLDFFDMQGFNRLTYQFTGRLNADQINPLQPPAIGSLVNVFPGTPFAAAALKSTSHYQPPLGSHDAAAGAYATVRHFDSNSMLTEETTTEITRRYYYDADGDVLSRPNLIRSEDQGSDGAIRAVVHVYEPLFNQICATYSARGLDQQFTPPNGGANAPERYSVQMTYDYQEGDLSTWANPARYAAAQWRINLAQPSLMAKLSGWGVSAKPITAPRRSNLGDINGDGLTSQSSGNVLATTRSAREFVRPDDSNSGFVMRRAETKRAYNMYSQLIRTQDAEGQLTTFEYHSVADPDGDGAPSAPLPYPGGASVVHDTTSGPDGGGFVWKRQSAPALGVTIQSYYDQLGRATLVLDGRGSPTTSVFNACDELVQMTDGLGHDSKWLYDANGNVVQARRANAGPSFDANGHPTGGQQSSSDLVVDLVYDILDQLVERSQRMGAAQADIVTRYRYDRGGNCALVLLPEWSTGSGNVTARVYDELGRVWTTSRGGLPAGFFSTVAHADLNTPLLLTIPAGSAEISTAENRYTQTLKTREIDAEGKHTRTVYDSLLRVARIEQPLNTTSHFTWDADGNPTQKWVVGGDGHGGTATLNHELYRFDEMGRRYQVDQLIVGVATTAPAADGPLTPGDGMVSERFAFDRSGRLTRRVDDNRHVTKYTYDVLDRVASVADHKGNARHYTYDKSSNPIRVDEHEILPTGAIQLVRRWRFYDAVGRIVAEVDEAGHAKRFAYDSIGSLVFSSDAEGPLNAILSDLDSSGDHGWLPGMVVNGHGNTRRFVYDRAGREVLQSDALRNGGSGSGAIVGEAQQSTTWDRNGRVLRRTDPNGNETAYNYDDWNRVSQIVYGDGAATSVELYARDGLLTRYRDANGTVVSNTYDDLRRLTRKDIIPGPGVLGPTLESFSFDGLGRLTRAQNDHSVVTRHYDTLSRLLQEDLNGDVTRAEFDGVGNNTRRVYPGGRIIDIKYDELDRPESIADASGKIASYGYSGFDRMTSRVNGNGTKWSIDYDAAGLVQSSTTSDAVTGSHLDRRDFTWDRRKNKTSRQNTLRSVTHSYHYDSLSRMVSASMTGAHTGATSYSLDLAGNRTVVSGLWNPGAYALLGSDAAVHQYTQTPTESRGYDAVGNLTQRAHLYGPGLAVGQARYDYANRMVEYVDYQGGVATTHRYAYDALGRRISKSLDVNGAPQVTLFRYVGDRICEERGGSGAVVASYVHGFFVDEVISMRRHVGTTASDYYYYADDQFNVLGLMDSNGAVVESYDYADWGQVLDAATQQPITASAFGNRFFFTGREFDFETGWYWYRTRYYDPIVGRFTSRDTIGQWSDPTALGNGYTYCGNNPWSLLDPYGTDAWDCLRGVVRGLGSGAWDVLKGLSESALNPYETIKNVIDAFKDLANQLLDGNLEGALSDAFPKTAKLVKAINSGCPKWDTEEFGELLGEALSELAPSIAGAGGGVAAAIGSLKVVKQLKGLRGRGGASSKGRPGGGLDGESGSKSGPTRSGTQKCFAASTLLLLAQGLASIEDVQLGARVADTGLEQSPSQERCGEQEWCALTAELETSDGRVQELRLLRPAEWLDGGELAPGAWISLRTGGMEFDSFARVTGVEPGAAESGPGALVLATMSREVDRCLSIHLRDQSEPLLVTAEHPLWRAAAGFVPAGRLAVGDLLATQHGAAEIEAIATLEGPVRVVNLEVDRTNSYFIGAALVLAHNDCPDGDATGRNAAFRDAKRQNDLPVSQQPDRVIKPATPEGDAAGLRRGENVRLYEFSDADGNKIHIREDRPVTYTDGGSQGKHFNSGPAHESGKLPQHHYFDG